MRKRKVNQLESAAAKGVFSREKSSAKSAVWWLLWLFVLVPVSVDHDWNIAVARYDVRLNYIGAALGVARLVTLGVMSQGWREWLIRYFRRPWVMAFAALFPIGVVGTIFSENQGRSVFFLVWTVGTLVGVPLLVGAFTKALGSWVPRSLIFYLSIQSAVALFDAAACGWTKGKFQVGKVIRYYTSRVPEGMCRPHVWYQEPTYFAAFGLFVAVLARYWSTRDSSRGFRFFCFFAYAVAMLAVVASTSRMGWVGVAVLLAYEVFRLFRRIRTEGLRGRGLALSALAVVFLAGAGLGTGVLQHWATGAYHYGIKVFVDSIGDRTRGFGRRAVNLESALSVFQANPLVGAGPGGAGAYIAKHLPGDPWVNSYPDPSAKRELIVNDPVSYSMWGELLSEWGALGALAFAIGLVFLFRDMQPNVRVPFVLVFLVVSMTWQTIPRFDLWLAVACVWAVSGARISERARASIP